MAMSVRAYWQENQNDEQDQSHNSFLCGSYLHRMVLAMQDNLNFARGSSRARITFHRERQLILVPRANSLLI